jgi:hypothetical protein
MRLLLLVIYMRNTMSQSSASGIQWVVRVCSWQHIANHTFSKHFLFLNQSSFLHQIPTLVGRSGLLEDRFGGGPIAGRQGTHGPAHIAGRGGAGDAHRASDFGPGRGLGNHRGGR